MAAPPSVAHGDIGTDAVWPDGPAAGASGRGQPRPGGAAVSLAAKVRLAGQGASAAAQPCVAFATQRGGGSTPAEADGGGGL